MLEVCHGSQTYTEYAAQFSTWAILASPLILGNDIRSMSPECLAIVANKEVIAVNQDPLGLRGKLVLQWPQATWPSVDPARLSDAPLPTFNLAMAPCNASEPLQGFTYSASDRLIRSVAEPGACLTYGGFKESNFYAGECTGWTAPGIGSQQWLPNATSGALTVVDNVEKVADVLDCDPFKVGSVQVGTGGGGLLYLTPRPPGVRHQRAAVGL